MSIYFRYIAIIGTVTEAHAFYVSHAVLIGA